ncbi:hypothetical protein [Photobacterium sp. GB-72]|uniref:hypothetical protein n=1 Tax=Photobacterium sp. GB-72 TaxID=2022105 RepID=UPI000D16F7D4|nr:hypothetical protein [Photobacterium sp. GB-72]PSV30331.1 hypothetical protein C9J40_13695 [Photobacterium sp. GB-72]
MITFKGFKEKNHQQIHRELRENQLNDLLKSLNNHPENKGEFLTEKTEYGYIIKMNGAQFNMTLEQSIDHTLIVNLQEILSNLDKKLVPKKRINVELNLREHEFVEELTQLFIRTDEIKLKVLLDAFKTEVNETLRDEILLTGSTFIKNIKNTVLIDKKLAVFHINRFKRWIDQVQKRALCNQYNIPFNDGVIGFPDLITPDSELSDLQHEQLGKLSKLQPSDDDARAKVDAIINTVIDPNNTGGSDLKALSQSMVLIDLLYSNDNKSRKFAIDNLKEILGGVDVDNTEEITEKTHIAPVNKVGSIEPVSKASIEPVIKVGSKKPLTGFKQFKKEQEEQDGHVKLSRSPRAESIHQNREISSMFADFDLIHRKPKDSRKTDPDFKEFLIKATTKSGTVITMECDVDDLLSPMFHQRLRQLA